MPVRRRQKKRNAGPRQKQKQPHAVINPLVNPGNPPHRHQTRPKADPTRTHHRMVTVAQSSPSSRSALSPQKTATVMLGQAIAGLLEGAEGDIFSNRLQQKPLPLAAKNNKKNNKTAMT